MNLAYPCPECVRRTELSIPTVPNPVFRSLTSRWILPAACGIECQVWPSIPLFDLFFSFLSLPSHQTSLISYYQTYYIYNCFIYLKSKVNEVIVTDVILFDSQYKCISFLDLFTTHHYHQIFSLSLQKHFYSFCSNIQVSAHQYQFLQTWRQVSDAHPWAFKLAPAQ